MKSGEKNIKIGFIGGTRYENPLSSTSKKKFEGLASLGDIYVIGFSTNWKPGRFSQLARFFLLPAPSPFIIRYFIMFAGGFLISVWCILRYRVNLWVCQSPIEAFPATLAAAVSRLAGKKISLVIESHGDFEISVFLHRRILFPSLYKALIRTISKFTLKRAVVLRAVSNSTRNQLKEVVGDKTILVFPTWTDINVFKHAGQFKRPSKSDLFLLFAGALIPRKGVHYLLDAFSTVNNRWPDVTLKIIGKAENKGYVGRLRGQIDRLGINKSVELMDPMPQSQLADQLSQAFLFVFPTESEGQPRVVFEAMATGTTVIASAVSGIPEIIQNKVTGFLCPCGDVKCFTERILWCIDHPEETYEIGRKAREFATSFYSKESYVENYSRLINMAREATLN